MATASRREHRRSTGATLAFTLVLLSFGGGATGATIALLNGLSFATTPVLTNVDAALVVSLCGVAGVAFFLPVGVVLLAS